MGTWISEVNSTPTLLLLIQIFQTKPQMSTWCLGKSRTLWSHCDAASGTRLYENVMTTGEFAVLGKELQRFVSNYWGLTEIIFMSSASETTAHFWLLVFNLHFILNESALLPLLQIHSSVTISSPSPVFLFIREVIDAWGNGLARQWPQTQSRIYTGPPLKNFVVWLTQKCLPAQRNHCVL